MNRRELLQLHSELCNNARTLMSEKNKDYAGHRGDEPFANFTRCQDMGITTTEKGFLVRMTDKLSRLSSFMSSGKFAVKEETLKDTLIDLINYSVLLYAYTQEPSLLKHLK